MQVFVPPRAQALPAEMVEGWKRSMRFKEGVRVVGRQTLFAAGERADGCVFWGGGWVRCGWLHSLVLLPVNLKVP